MDRLAVGQIFHEMKDRDQRYSPLRPAVALPGHCAPPPQPRVPEAPAPVAPLEANPAWDTGSGWKQHLNNLRLLLQPYTASCLLLPWLHLVPLPHVQAVQTGFAALGSLVNTFRLALPT